MALRISDNTYKNVTLKMNSIFYFLATGALVSSARRTLDVNIDPYHSFDGRYLAEGRNVDYRSNLNRETFSDDTVYKLYINRPVNTNQYNSDYSFDTESDDIVLRSKKMDTFHNKGHDESEFKLRTNVYPTKKYEMPELSTEMFNDSKQPGSKTLVDNSGKEEDGEEEIPWVWGSEPEPKENTKDVDDDLDDRAAFDGSLCPRGYAKVLGICAERH